MRKILILSPRGLGTFDDVQNVAFTVNVETGDVIDAAIDITKWGMAAIPTRFDLDEYFAHYGELPQQIQLLDIRYSNADQTVEPDKDFRETRTAALAEKKRKSAVDCQFFCRLPLAGLDATLAALEEVGVDTGPIDEFASQRNPALAECRNELLTITRKLYANDEIEIDDDACLSESDGGTWVQAWVWVPENDESEEEDDDDDDADNDTD